ncbi:MAG: glycoside hydrolase family 78 protein [Chloroflexi bacterium]|nr:glycoside hydrolase family 78 protein [Chloroflexota bacterium]MCI0576176.1 glycoside hydrolase family 78 protein [Chloroflexota bacterium]MCI0648971.1 glycoside hydrolase family 78 protein [Chloroflexota bacterium]MCI0728187.1 glycoside hydrolase family 78 protein [Chloroflexota bacterium]
MVNASIVVTGLTCEYQANPIGLDVRPPRLSWRLEAGERNVRQTAYHLLVADDLSRLEQGDGNCWDSGRVFSEDSIHQVYQGRPLESGRRYWWKVRVWDNRGQLSAWSEPAFWEMGLLNPVEWQAEWIQPDLAEDVSVPPPCPLLRTTFPVAGNVQSARAYVTSLGLYEMELNGQRVGDLLFTPGWTSYHKRLQYQTYEVTGYLKAGLNAVGVTLGDGWYRGYLGWHGRRNVYGRDLALLLQLVIVYADGRVQVAGTDASWKAATGPILKSDIYNGESYDARLERASWSTAGYDDHDWAGVRVVEHSQAILVAQAGPPVRRIEELRPAGLVRTLAGETVVDMGQNMVGWVRLQVQGQAGDVVTLRHAETLDQQGNLYTENLRSAQQTDQYVLKGGGEEVYEPHFTFHGFRYVAVAGYPGELTLDRITGIVIHSDTPPTGHFECSRPLLNQLQRNIVWGQKGNFLEVPTDCPQRDERLGWTGDAQVFLRTACFNRNVAGFFTRWLKDLAADQYEDGCVPHVIPDVLGKGGSAAWGDAAVIGPWTIYLCYGDTRILAEQYDSMAAWVNYVWRQAGDRLIWDSGSHFGDWLAINSTNPGSPYAVTDVELIATAFFAYSTSIVQQAARVLGKEEEAATYAHLLAQIKAAFGREFVTPNGRLASNTQTAYILALMFDLLPPSLHAGAARRLAEDVRKRGHHLTTGFVGTPYLCHVLSRYGYLDLAYALLEQESYPSWLYPVTQGATTIWERWDGLKPDGTFQDPSMNSLNHYAYGAIGEWLYRVVAGIEVDPGAPGYKRILIRPQPGGQLTSAGAWLDSMVGRIESRWALENGRFELAVTIPANTEAIVHLPAPSLVAVTEQGLPLGQVEAIHEIQQENGQVIVKLGSGRYRFSWPAATPVADEREE